jgi:hypothetical protein
VTAPPGFNLLRRNHTFRQQGRLDCHEARSDAVHPDAVESAIRSSFESMLDYGARPLVLHVTSCSGLNTRYPVLHEQIQAGYLRSYDVSKMFWLFPSDVMKRGSICHIFIPLHINLAISIPDSSLTSRVSFACSHAGFVIVSSLHFDSRKQTRVYTHRLDTLRCRLDAI